MKFRMPFSYSENSKAAVTSVPTEAGWLLVGLATTPIHDYALQLVDEQYAKEVGDDLLISWNNIYRLLQDEAHADSIHLLNLPAISSLVPIISSSGSPSDTAFRIRLDGWFEKSSPAKPVAAKRTGAVISTADSVGLLPSTAYDLISVVIKLGAEGPELTASQRMLRTATIQDLAKKTGATLDSYLTRRSPSFPGSSANRENSR